MAARDANPFPHAIVRDCAVDPDRDLVAVVRWVVDVIPVLAAITAAVPVAAR